MPLYNTEFGKIWSDEVSNELPQNVKDYVLLQYKNIKKKEIENDRDKECTKDISALNHYFQADDISKELLSNHLVLVNLGAPMTNVWRSSDNINVEITDISQLLEIAGAMSIQTNDAYLKSWVLKSQVDSAISKEEIDLIKWDEE